MKNIDSRELKCTIEAYEMKNTFGGHGDQYSYIRVTSESGDPVMLRDVLVPEGLSSFIKKGKQVTLHILLAEIKKGTTLNIMVGLHDGEKGYFDHYAFNRSIEEIKSLPFMMLLAGIAITFFGIIGSIFIIGLFLLPIGIWLIVKSRKGAKGIKKLRRLLEETKVTVFQPRQYVEL